MQKFLSLYALLATALLVAGYRSYRSDRLRHRENLQALASDLTRYRTRLDEEVVSSQALRLQCAEFERLRAEDADRIRRLGIRLRRLEASSRTVARSDLALRAPLRDTVIRRIRDTVVLRDTLRMFRWHDRWVSVEGLLQADSVACRIESIDTLRQIVHRIPRRFLFIRWGTKALRQEVWSTNPHTKIVHAEYLKIER